MVTPAARRGAVTAVREAHGISERRACAILGTGPEIACSEVVEVLSDLVAKSLVLTEPNGRTERYRLLDTTRAYALEKLAESGELEAVARRHAEFYRDLFEPPREHARPSAAPG
jgi:predicted ATPase